MRFATASLFFVIASFIFFMMWAVGYFVLTEFDTSLDVVDSDMPSEYFDVKNLLINSFGILCAIFFVAAVLSIFLLEALADEPEMYWRERRH